MVSPMPRRVPMTSSPDANNFAPTQAGTLPYKAWVYSARTWKLEPLESQAVVEPKKSRGVVNGATLEDLLEKRNGRRFLFKWDPHQSWSQDFRHNFTSYLGCFIWDRVAMMADTWSFVDDDSVNRVYNGLSVFFDIEDIPPLYNSMDKRSIKM